jgi:hypothetical protein
MTFDFQSEFDRAWGHVTERLGNGSAVFTPTSGDPVSLGIVLTLNTEVQPSGNAQTWEMGTTIEYSLEDIGREAVVGETFTIGETVYTVKKIESNNGYAVKAVVK